MEMWDKSYGNIRNLLNNLIPLRAEAFKKGTE